MTKEDVYKTLDAVPYKARETHKHIYFKKSVLKRLKIKTELTKKGFKVYGINDDCMPYAMVVSGTSVFV